MIQDCTDISTFKIFVLLFHWFVFDIEDDKHRGHGDDNPVEGGGDGCEPGVFVDLDEEAEAEPDQDCDMKVKEAEQDCNGRWQQRQRPLYDDGDRTNMKKQLPNINLMTMTKPSIITTTMMMMMMMIRPGKYESADNNEKNKKCKLFVTLPQCVHNCLETIVTICYNNLL